MASQLSFLGVSWKCQPTCSCREGEDGKVGYGVLESLREIFMKPSWSGDGECGQQGEHCSYELWGGEGCEWNSWFKKHMFQPKLRKFSDDIYNWLSCVVVVKFFAQTMASHEAFLGNFPWYCWKPKFFEATQRGSINFVLDFMVLDSGLLIFLAEVS